MIRVHCTKELLVKVMCWCGVSQLIDGCISACYQPAGVLSAVAAELTSSRGLQLSASDCVELLRRHREQVTAVLDELLLTQWKPSLDGLSSRDVTNLCGFSLVSVYLPHCLFLLLMILSIIDFIN